MSLSGYVLAARLEQVAASASERLLRMSSGRYSLVHTADGGRGRARGGLTLRVLDAWTGVERDPATLSGGETFSPRWRSPSASPTSSPAEAGGALLETLFVDEGFGSLDDDTLDEVMGVLDGLRDGGRTVGIVSHVADLRQRVPAQLRVEKGRPGSSAAVSPSARRSLDVDGVLADVGHRVHHLEGGRKTGGPSSPPRRTTRRSRPGSRWPASWPPSTTSPTSPAGLRGCGGSPERWLTRHGLPRRPAGMRPSGDYRPARVMKLAAVRGWRRTGTSRS